MGTRQPPSEPRQKGSLADDDGLRGSVVQETKPLRELPVGGTDLEGESALSHGGEHERDRNVRPDAAREAEPFESRAREEDPVPGRAVELLEPGGDVSPKVFDGEVGPKRE
jgi:hypothetical protein